MNLSIGENVEDIVKRVTASKFVKKDDFSSPRSWYAVFAINGETIEDAGISLPYDASSALPEEVSEAWFIENIYNKLVDEVVAKYVKTGCYIVVDFVFDGKNGATNSSKPILIKYIPDSTAVRNKMLLGSSFQAFKRRAAFASAFELSNAQELAAITSSTRGF